MPEITPLSEAAFVTLAMCEKTKKPYGITVDKGEFGLYKMVWSFKIDYEKAQREGYDRIKVSGGIVEDANFPGCPYCESKHWYSCNNCHTIICYHGQSHVSCPKCGCKGEITKVEKINIEGSAY